MPAINRNRKENESEQDYERRMRKNEESRSYKARAKGKTAAATPAAATDLASAQSDQTMASPRREGSLPTRGIEEHLPAVPSPLNPDSTHPQARERQSRSKKETLKKREAKGSSLLTEADDPKQRKAPTVPHTLLRIRLPLPKEDDFKEPNGPKLVVADELLEIKDDDGNVLEIITLYKTSELKGFRYASCIADPKFPASQYWRQTESKPYCARASFEDSHEEMLFDETAMMVTSPKGWRQARANVCARSGRWYYEVKVIKGIPIRDPLDPETAKDTAHNVRMGWSRREASLDLPIGTDAYGYGIRDTKGQKLWRRRPEAFFPIGEEVQTGDVIGFEISLPGEHLHHKIVNGTFNPAVDIDDDDTPIPTALDIVRDRIPIKFKGNNFFEEFEYLPTEDMIKFTGPQEEKAGVPNTHVKPDQLSPTYHDPSLRTLPGSYIRVYKNGKDMGKSYENLLAFLPPASKLDIKVSQTMPGNNLDDGMAGYYPAISVLRGSAAKFNFGPDFEYPPPGYEAHDDEVDMVGSGQLPIQKKLRAMCERYNDQICEDILFDIIEEAANSKEDEDMGLASSSLALMDTATSGMKELIQDDE